MDNNDRAFLEAYYENYDEEGRLLSKHGNVEFFTTMHYIRKYLFPGARVTEIGAGTGRYSHALAQEGYAVDAVELVPHNIALFEQKTLPGEPVTVRQGDARSLSFFADDTYDITLLLGPMYHLFTREDQRQALTEAVRVTKPGGVIFAAYCMGDASILCYGFQKGQIHSLIEKCMLDPETFDTFSHPWDLFELYRPEDIEALRETLPVTPLRFVAADGYTNHMRETVDAMDEETYRLFLQYHLSTCERKDLIGYSHHTLDIFRKN